MKVLLCVDWLVPWNGTSKVVGRIANRLSTAGYTISIATKKYDNSNHWVSEDVEVFKLKSKNPVAFIKEGPVNLNEYDIVHSHDNLGLRFLNSSTPHITTSHSNWPRSWFLSKKHFAAGIIKEMPHEFLLRKADRVVSVSEYSRKQLARRGTKSKRIYNGVDIPGGLHGDENNILFVGTIGPRKAKYLPEIWESVVQRREDLKLKVVGKETDEKIVSKMKELPQCEVIGKVDRVEPHFKNAGVLLFPSRAEACPLTLLEAQSFGCQAVGFDICSNNELIKEGVSGFTVPPYECDIFAEKISQASYQVKQNSEQVIEHIENKFGIENMVESYAKEYEKLI